jgi:hypothetical protein
MTLQEKRPSILSLIFRVMLRPQKSDHGKNENVRPDQVPSCQEAR